MVVGREALEINLEVQGDAWCYSNGTIGNGCYQDIRDIVFIDPASFSLQETAQIANEIGELNRYLRKEGRSFILVGFGRIGTADRWLGIPVTWDQISQARIIVEVDRKDLRPEPSLCSHFFHNLISTNMGYFHIQYENEASSRIEWEWLMEQPVVMQTKYVKLIRREEPFIVKIDGRSFKGNIYK